MPLPKKVKTDLDIIYDRTLLERRRELLDKITENETFLPKSLLHEDFDRGMLDFVKNDLQIISQGEIIPFLDRIISTQNWSQYTETWTFIDGDNNPVPPFITLVKMNDTKYGSNPATQYTIPDRRPFYFASVPTWDGQRNGYDIYSMPQPVPIDIQYSVKLITNRNRDLNELNKKVHQKFSSRQAYTVINGHYVPIILTNISDESQINTDSRKFYLISYDFTMLGFLIDEAEFEVKPAINRISQVFETQLDPQLPNFEKANLDIVCAEVQNSFFVEYSNNNIQINLDDDISLYDITNEAIINCTDANLIGKTVFVSLLQDGITYNLGEQQIPILVTPRESGRISGEYTILI